MLLGFAHIGALHVWAEYNKLSAEQPENPIWSKRAQKAYEDFVDISTMIENEINK